MIKISIRKKVDSCRARQYGFLTDGHVTDSQGRWIGKPKIKTFPVLKYQTDDGKKDPPAP